MDRQSVLLNAERFVYQELGSDSSGHDPSHIIRVVRATRAIARAEGADAFVCELAAWLHDIADEKLAGSQEAGLRKVRDWLAAQEVEPEAAEHVLAIIAGISFAGGGGARPATLEGQVVQDADRLDALGAIGIARTFAYAGAKGGAMHDPQLPPRSSMTREQYRSGRSTAINHFYEKLLLLKERMNTAYGRQMAEGRHRFMEEYLRQFLIEWEGEA